MSRVGQSIEEEKGDLHRTAAAMTRKELSMEIDKPDRKTFKEDHLTVFET